ncbi:MATE family efflux transporter [Alteromonas gracilis]|uniref:MATE family efflux transporter n=1 Tax=Alteromonas gracilis TaxID=1479524 RepID=UPI002FDF4CFF
MSALSGLILAFCVTQKFDEFAAGEFFLFLAILGMLSTFFRIGLDNVILKNVGINNSKSNVSNIYAVSTLAVFTFYSVCLALVYITKQLGIAQEFFEYKYSFFLIKVLPFYSLNIISSFLFQAQQKTFLSLLALNIVQNLSVSIYLVLATKVDIENLILQYQILAILIFIAINVFIYYRNGFPNFQIKFEAKLLLYTTLSFWVIALANQSTIWFGQIYAAFYVDSGQIAFLSTAQRLSSVISLMLMAVNMVIAPKIAYFFKKGAISELKSLVQTSTTFLFVFVTFPVILITLWADSIMTLFGKQYSEASELLKIFCFAQLINVMTGPVGFILGMSGNERTLRNVVIIANIINIVVGVLFIPTFGVYGAALATATGMIFQNIMLVYFVYRKFSFLCLPFFKLEKLS